MYSGVKYFYSICNEYLTIIRYQLSATRDYGLKQYGTFREIHPQNTVMLLTKTYQQHTNRGKPKVFSFDFTRQNKYMTEQTFCTMRFLASFCILEKDF